MNNHQYNVPYIRQWEGYITIFASSVEEARLLLGRGDWEDMTDTDELTLDIQYDEIEEVA